MDIINHWAVGPEVSTTNATGVLWATVAVFFAVIGFMVFITVREFLRDEIERMRRHEGDEE